MTTTTTTPHADDLRITVHLESREAYAFSACCWYLHRLDPAAPAVVHVLNSRDAYARKMVFLTDAASSSAWFKNRLLDYGVEASEPLGTDGKPEPYKKLTLRGDRACVSAFITEALDAYRKYISARACDDDDGVPYWTWDDDAGVWCRGRTKRSRPMSTLFLPTDADRLVADFRHFVSPDSLDRYRELHVAPTRLYMLHGRPGTGKSTLVHCIASDMKYGVAVMTIGAGMTDADLHAALGSLPSRCVLCIEDVDALFAGGRRMAAGSQLTFAGVLSALDNCGCDEGTGTGVFMTTNQLCVLDPALKRRLDYILEFGYATKVQAQRMFTYYFPHSTAFEQFWQRIHGRPFCMSVLQKYLLKSLTCGDPLRDFEHFELLAACATDDPSVHDAGHMYA